MNRMVIPIKVNDGIMGGLVAIVSVPIRSKAGSKSRKGAINL